MHQEVQTKIDKLLEPPPVKGLKPLPKPDDPIRKKRGGKRYVAGIIGSSCSNWVTVFDFTLRVRKMKDRYAQSNMRKQTNRMTFGEVGAKDF